MKNKDILSLERERHDEDLYSLYLIMNNNGWYRAYEWSAFMLRNFPNKVPENEKLKPTKQYIKSLDTDEIFVGIKYESFDKFIPGIKDSINIDGNSLIKIDVSEYFSDKYTLNNYKDVLDAWKKSVQLKGVDNNVTEEIVCDADDILNKIYRFQIDRHTPIECMIFLSDIKRNVINIVK